MTRTAISPRLAMRTFFSTLRLSNRNGRQAAVAHRPEAATTLSRPVGCVPCRAPGSPTSGASTSIDSTNRYLLDEARGRRPRGGGGGGRPPDGRPGPAGPALGGAAGRQPAGVGPAPARSPARAAAPGQRGGGPGRRRGRRTRWPAWPSGSSGPTTCWPRRAQAGRGAGRGRPGRPLPAPAPGVRRRPDRGRHRDQRELARARRRPRPPSWSGSATSLCQLAGTAVDRAALLDALLAAPRSHGSPTWAPTRPGPAGGRLRARCTTLGTRVRVELAGETLRGDGHRPHPGRATWWSDVAGTAADGGGRRRRPSAGPPA